MEANQISVKMVSLEVLIERSIAGDEASFNQLVNLWYKRIFNYALKQCSYEDLASDITQKTFIAVYRNLNKLKDFGSFKPWIYRIATNFCNEEGRKKVRSKTVPFTMKKTNDGETMIVEEGEAEGFLFNPEMTYRQKEMERILFSCINELPDDQKGVVIMKEYEGMKFREIADVLNTSENTVKTWLYRGLKSLKKRMEERNITKETLNYEL